MSLIRSILAVCLTVMLALGASVAPGAAQEAPVTPLPELVATFDVNDGYALQEQRMDGYLFQSGAPGDAIATANPVVAETFANAGVVDAYGRASVFVEDTPHSTLYPEALGTVQLQSRVLTFASAEQAEAFVNSHPQLTRDEFAASGDPSQLVELVKLPYTPGAASGWRTEVAATDANGVEYVRSNVNYTAQFGNSVVMGRAFAPSDLAEPMAREVLLLQMVCVQMDVPCDTIPVPTAFPISEQSAAEFPEGKITTSTTADVPVDEQAPAEEASPAAAAEEPAAPAPLPGSTAASLPVSGAVVNTGAHWLVSDPIVGDTGEALLLAGTNDNAVVAVVNGSDANAVNTAINLAMPGIGELTPIEISPTNTIHSVTVNGVIYGVFSTWSANDTGQAFVVSYIAPVSTFAAGLADGQTHVSVNDWVLLRGVDAAVIQEIIVAAAGQGDAAAEAALPPLFPLAAP